MKRCGDINSVGWRCGPWTGSCRSGAVSGKPSGCVRSSPGEQTHTSAFASLPETSLLNRVMGRPLKLCSMKLSPVKQASLFSVDEGGHLVLITSEQGNTIGLFSPALDPVRSDLAWHFATIPGHKQKHRNPKPVNSPCFCFTTHFWVLRRQTVEFTTM